MSTESIQVYVPLLNEGTDVFRPTTGVIVGPDLVRLEATLDYDPDAEEWQFPPGSIVRCLAERRSEGLIPIARDRSLAASATTEPTISNQSNGR